MKVFVSHNKADKASARALAVLLVEQGADVWFDEWEIAPGQSIVGGIEAGISDCNIFAIFWSEAAQKSNWVGAELRAFLRRRIDDAGLRIVPLMADKTPLPALVADYRGFDLSSGVTLDEVVAAMTGKPRDVEIAKLLQQKLISLTKKNTHPSDPHPHLVCPSCGSEKLKRSSASDQDKDDMYYLIDCEECGWGDWTQ